MHDMSRHFSRSSKPNRHWHQPEWHVNNIPLPSRPMCLPSPERPTGNDKGKGGARKGRAKAEA
eukprot:1458087-Lingulodinium_polyedra.AAC.1